MSNGENWLNAVLLALTCAEKTAENAADSTKRDHKISGAFLRARDAIRAIKRSPEMEELDRITTITTR